MIEIKREQAEKIIKDGKRIWCKGAEIEKINASEAMLTRDSGKYEIFPIGVVEYRMAKNRKWYA